ncbi:hypothetical protein AVEN_199673-1 [Araneus ventricosus]|uniref:Uncharacterized protein n=1 Tax=Araneus ventricosus TaxID=182803 RepID=A0A4Y2DF46_ARAVE|nr:hypothetical protein AVEN_199673-1 [Araneus ventricosus]
MMRQLSLGVINNIPSRALVLYTDGSKSDSSWTGSGVYARAEDGLVFRCRFRNPDNCSVFRSELLAIREALDFALRFETSDTYILTEAKVQSNGLLEIVLVCLFSPKVQILTDCISQTS